MERISLSSMKRCKGRAAGWKRTVIKRRSKAHRTGGHKAEMRNLASLQLVRTDCLPPHPKPTGGNFFGHLLGGGLGLEPERRSKRAFAIMVAGGSCTWKLLGPQG